MLNLFLTYAFSNLFLYYLLPSSLSISSSHSLFFYCFFPPPSVLHPFFLLLFLSDFHQFPQRLYTSSSSSPLISTSFLSSSFLISSTLYVSFTSFSSTHLCLLLHGFLLFSALFILSVCQKLSLNNDNLDIDVRSGSARENQQQNNIAPIRLIRF